jgi:hypothetical protein
VLCGTIGGAKSEGMKWISTTTGRFNICYNAEHILAPWMIEVDLKEDSSLEHISP